MKSVNLPAVAVNAAKSAKSAFPWDVAGAGAASVLSFVTQLVNNHRMQQNFEEQMEFNKEQADINRIFNSIPSLVNQYKAAGLNPNLITSASGSSSMAESPSAPNFDSGHVMNPLNGFSQNAYTLHQIENQQRLTDANVRLMDSEAFKNEMDAQETALRDGNYYASIVERNMATIRELDAHANYFDNLSKTEDGKQELQKIEKDWLPLLYQSQRDWYNAQSGELRSRMNLNDQQWQLIHKSEKYILQGYKWNYEKKNFTFTASDGREYTASFSPAELDFWRDYFAVQNGELGYHYSDKYGDAQIISKLVDDGVSTIQKGVETGMDIKTKGATKQMRELVNETHTYDIDPKTGKVKSHRKTLSRQRPPLTSNE